ncbi:MAG: membrane protein insertion efficiency factor YidD [Gemmatimonadetes bacterium]|nr:membrane protein insertion efficiency factor YidD [Gemmatimonadota bacterium]MCH2452560.1 membrane protein insertion efficiency factor YidD [Gemmatimonadota bacterium]
MFQRMILGAIRFYQRGISPLLGPSCRFEPSCSEYARQAVETHGPARGIFLSTRRLLRCHPLSRKYGPDPVPPARG